MIRSRHARGGRSLGAPAARLFIGLLAALLLLSSMGFARPRKPRLIPRTAAGIAQIMQGGSHDADCADCHTMHAKDQVLANEHALKGPDDNTLCEGCHHQPWEGGYAGPTLYLGSAHGAGLSMIWPGPSPPPRTELGADGKCLNCHDPHGWQDRDGTIPHLVNAREEALCLTCHDGAHAESDVRSELQKPFTHPTSTVRGRHDGPDENDPQSFAISPINRRHAECEDCHNPHLTRHEEGLPGPAPEASKRLLGVSRVAVVNGAAGAPPAYTFIPASDTTTVPVAEYQLCFKCHSSWTRQPGGQTDFGRMLNPANPSTHPIEAPGANPNIDPLAFAGGWTATSMTRCGDCHASDSGEGRAPHGSVHPFILKAAYDASEATRAMAQDELCFRCHSFDVYANPGAAEATRRASRFSSPGAGHGHAEHVGTDQVPCFACHVTHGSTDQKHLIAIGRNPGMLSYSESVNGGTCLSSCHDLRSYTVSYAR